MLWASGIALSPLAGCKGELQCIESLTWEHLSCGLSQAWEPAWVGRDSEVARTRLPDHVMGSPKLSFSSANLSQSGPKLFEIA